MFRSMADNWWRTIEATYTALADDIVWERFKKAFCKKFIPDDIWVQKIAKFDQLTQGPMTVQQYEIQFN